MKFCRKCQDRLPETATGPYCAPCCGSASQFSLKVLREDHLRCARCERPLPFSDNRMFCSDCFTSQRSAHRRRMTSRWGRGVL